MANSKQADILQKLIRVKEQRAKQKLADMQKEQQGIKSEVHEIESLFFKMGQDFTEFHDWKMAAQNKCPERLLQVLDRLRKREQAVGLSIADAEQELRISLHAAEALSASKSR